jgi:hypothetical protein
MAKQETVTIAKEELINLIIATDYQGILDTEAI